jgi:hypothetical protein
VQAVGFSELFVFMQQTICRHIQQQRNLNVLTIEDHRAYCGRLEMLHCVRGLTDPHVSKERSAFKVVDS